MKKVFSKLKILLPWFIAAAIFYYLFKIYPPEKIWNALHFVKLGYFIPFAIGYFIFLFYTDVFSLRFVLGRFDRKIPMKQLMPARGVTYLLMILNYGAAQAGFAYYLKRRHQIPIWDALSIFFFVMLIDLYWVISLSFVGSFFLTYQIKGVALKELIWMIAGGAYFSGLIFYLVLRGTLKEGRQNFISRWIKEKPVFRVVREAKLKDILQLAMLRAPIHVSLLFSMYIVLRTFEVSVPFLQILGAIPVAVLIGTIPITPGGLGTSNAAMVELLHTSLKGPMFDAGLITPAELLLAASLLWMFANYSLKVLTGSFFLNKISSDLFKPPPLSKGEEIV